MRLTLLLFFAIKFSISPIRIYAHLCPEKIDYKKYISESSVIFVGVLTEKNYDVFKFHSAGIKGSPEVWVNLDVLKYYRGLSPYSFMVSVLNSTIAYGLVLDEYKVGDTLIVYGNLYPNGERTFCFSQTCSPTKLFSKIADTLELSLIRDSVWKTPKIPLAIREELKEKQLKAIEKADINKKGLNTNESPSNLHYYIIIFLIVVIIILLVLLLKKANKG